MKKIKRTSQRFFSIVLCLSLFFLLCFSVSAAGSSISADSKWFQVLDYTSVSDNSNWFYYSDSKTVSLSLPAEMSIRDIDIIMTATYDFSCFVDWSGGTDFPLEVISLGDKLYRLRGNLQGKNFISLPLVFSRTGGNFSTLLSVRVNSVETNFFDDTCYFTVNNLPYKNFTGSDIYYYWDSVDNPTADRQFSSFIYLNNFTRYDYADVHFMVQAASIDSISCYLDNVSIPFEVSYLASDGDTWYEYESGELTGDARKFDICIRLDFSQLDPSLSGSPCIEIRGLTPYDFASNFVRIMEYTGFVVTGNTNPLFFYFKDLKRFFTDLFANTFGSSDSGASDAIQSQEQINAQINNQIVDAMQDWDTHYDGVKSSSDLALTNTFLPLQFLSNLADRVFGSMGWFGNIYILLGLLTVFYLLLSKSGMFSSANNQSSKSKGD